MVILFQDSNSLSSSPKDGNPVRQSPSLLPPPPYVQTVSQSVTPAAFVEHSEPAKRWFLKALLVALSISVLVGVFVSAAFGLPNSTRKVSFRQGVLGFEMLKTGYREGQCRGRPNRQLCSVDKNIWFRIPLVPFVVCLQHVVTSSTQPLYRCPCTVSHCSWCNEIWCFLRGRVARRNRCVGYGICPPSR